jgi:hypothetical protein
MNKLLNHLLPKNLLEWLIMLVVTVGYWRFMTILLLKGEVIAEDKLNYSWSIVEKISAFPIFYFGVDPLTGLMLNSLIWGLAFAKLLGYCLR